MSLQVSDSEFTAISKDSRTNASECSIKHGIQYQRAIIFDVERGDGRSSIVDPFVGTVEGRGIDV